MARSSSRGSREAARGFLPTPDSTLQAGDYLVVMMAKDGLETLDQSSSRVGASLMRVIVTGGGAIGRHLSADLAERGHDVTLIEQDRSLSDRLREEVPDVKVMFGDACEPRILEEAHLSDADVVVAATGDDEDNLVTSLLAKQEFAVPRVLARVNHPATSGCSTSSGVWTPRSRHRTC